MPEVMKFYLTQIGTNAGSDGTNAGGDGTNAGGDGTNAGSDPGVVIYGVPWSTVRLLCCSCRSL